MNLKELTTSSKPLKKLQSTHPVIELELRVKSKKRLKQDIWENAKAHGWL